MKSLIDILPTKMGESEGMDRTIESLLKATEITVKDIANISYYMDIKIKFIQPVRARHGRKSIESDTHIFKSLFVSESGHLCYKQKRNGRYGSSLPITLIESWEPIPRPSNKFKTYEEFRRRFDARFITEEEIKSLWDGKSGQHGSKYRKSDFRKLSRYGRDVVKEFMRFFKGVHPDTPKDWGEGYSKSEFGDYGVLTKKYRSSGRTSSVFGRDISISHQTNSPYVHYSSEYPGCGNGRYGLLINETTYLWLEDD